SANLTLGQCNPGAILGIYGWLSFNGGVTGTGSITATNSAGSANPYVEFNTLPVNNVGGITFNNGSILGAPVGTGTGINKITGGVGSNVQSITQASNSNPLTISGGSVTVNPAGLALNSTGSALLTVSAPTTGSGALTLNINSTGGITLSGAIGHTGGLVINLNGSGAPSIGTYNGNLTFGGTYTGAVAVASALSSGQLTLSGNASSSTFSGAWSVPVGGAQLSTSSSGTLTYSGVISGSTALSIGATGGGWVSLTGNNTFTGAVTLTQGTLNLGGASGNELGPVATSGTLTLNGGSFILLGAAGVGQRFSTLYLGSGASTVAVQNGGLGFTDVSSSAGSSLDFTGDFLSGGLGSISIVNPVYNGGIYVAQ
ncbi:MAG: hypothetical protein EBR81_17470, partial [Proteobacteria bacterium]|nr:hypothetical protein [Pseudomonadota bacterium]